MGSHGWQIKTKKEPSVGLIRQARGAQRQQMRGSLRRTDGQRPHHGQCPPCPQLLSHKAIMLAMFRAPILCQELNQALHLHHCVSHHSPLRKVELLSPFYSELEVQRTSVTCPRSAADIWLRLGLNLQLRTGRQPEETAAPSCPWSWKKYGACWQCFAVIHQQNPEQREPSTSLLFQVLISRAMFQ